jgi:cystathionine beta-lyase
MVNSHFDDLSLDELRGRQGAKWSRYAPDVLPAWVADMDFKAPEPIRAALEEVAALDDYGYPWFREQNPAVDAYVELMARRHGWVLEPERIHTLADVLQGIQLFIELASEPGDGIVIQTPIYPPFLMMIDDNDRRLVDNPLGSAAEGYPLDIDGLRAAVDERTRILLLCNPHNPTGRVFTRSELEALGELAVERDLLILSDEIHQDLIYPGHEHLPIASLAPEFAERTVTLTSATKSFNIAGLRCAVIVFGSQRLAEQFHSIPRFALGGVSSVGVRATANAWRHGQGWLDELMAYLDANRRHVESRVRSDLGPVTTELPESTFLAWLDCRDLEVGTAPAEFFHDKARVALNDGADFGPHGAGFVRLNFATSRAILDQILDRMADAVGS